MTARSVGPGAPPCAADPERWFDPRDRVIALGACLSCPVRRACASEALRTGATWGTWAGVWLDGTPNDVARRLLRAIAADRMPSRRSEREISPAPRVYQPTPLPRPRPMTGARIAAMVTARASGHCEVVSDGCSLAMDRQISRLPGRLSTESASAAELFGACRSCAEVIGGTWEFARSSGFVVDPAQPAASAPFRWRNVRWVLLGPHGELTETVVETVPSVDCA